MKRFLRKITAVVFMAAFLFPLFHRHVVHEKGLMAVHVDCLVCGWAQGQSVPALSLQKPVISHAALALGGITETVAHLSRSALSVFLSRGPPSLA
jgi:hypothetical protein